MEVRQNEVVEIVMPAGLKIFGDGGDGTGIDFDEFIEEEYEFFSGAGESLNAEVGEFDGFIVVGDGISIDGDLVPLLVRHISQHVFSSLQLMMEDALDGKNWSEGRIAAVVGGDAVAREGPTVRNEIIVLAGRENGFSRACGGSVVGSGQIDVVVRNVGSDLEKALAVGSEELAIGEK